MVVAGDRGRGALRSTPPAGQSQLGELPSFPVVMKAYFAHEEGDSDEGYLTASDDPDAVDLAARPLEQAQSEVRQRAAELERVMAAASFSREPSAGRMGHLGLAVAVAGEEYEDECGTDPSGRLARQAQSLWNGRSREQPVQPPPHR